MSPARALYRDRLMRRNISTWPERIEIARASHGSSSIPVSRAQAEHVPMHEDEALVKSEELQFFHGAGFAAPAGAWLCAPNRTWSDGNQAHACQGPPGASKGCQGLPMASKGFQRPSGVLEGLTEAKDAAPTGLARPWG